MNNIFLSAGIAFLCGSVPTAFLAGRFFKGVDIRTQGSGNVGATNAFRVLGKKIGALVFLVDCLKGWLPAYFFSKIYFSSDQDAALWIGLSAVAGHIFTPFLAFKGGKGVATGAGALFAAYPQVFAGVLAIWIIVFRFSGIVSLASILAALFLPVFAYILGASTQSLALFGFMTAVVFWTHKANIKRLLKGQEKRIINR